MLLLKGGSDSPALQHCQYQYSYWFSDKAPSSWSPARLTDVIGALELFKNEKH
jgi:hypothetical protein